MNLQRRDFIMSRKAKYTLEQKIQACEDYISGNKSAIQIANQLGMSSSGNVYILEWIRMYRENGYEGFLSSHRNSHYTKEFKCMVVQEYVSGLGSTRDLAIKYKIKSSSTVKNWISKYNRQEELQDYKPALEVYTMKTRKTTKEERIEIVKWCLDHNNDYKKTSQEFKCSYAQIYQWVNKYKKDGEEGLSDRRGQRKAEEMLTSEEKLRKENDRLNRRNEELEREIELLKKLNAFE